MASPRALSQTGEGANFGTSDHPNSGYLNLETSIGGINDVGPVELGEGYIGWVGINIRKEDGTIITLDQYNKETGNNLEIIEEMGTVRLAINKTAEA